MVLEPGQEGQSENLAVASLADAARVDPVSRFLEDALEWAKGTLSSEAIVRAKDEYFARTGKVFHDDDFYDRRMLYFSDMLLLGSLLDHEHSAHSLIDVYTRQLPAGEHAPFQGSYHSLFEVTKQKPNQIVVRDLITGQRFCVNAKSDQTFEGIECKDIFQGFLVLPFLTEGTSCRPHHTIATDGRAAAFARTEGLFSRRTTITNVYLANGIFFHPIETRRIILRAIRTRLKSETMDRDEVLNKLSHAHLRHLRQTNFDAKKLYQKALAAATP